MPEFDPIEELRKKLRLQNAAVDTSFNPPPPQAVAPQRPMMDAYQQKVGEAPQLSGYKMSRSRDILGRIAGGLAGLSGNPAVAASVNRDIRYGPYQRQQSQYQQELDQSVQLAALESAELKSEQDLAYQRARVGELGTREQRNLAAASASERANRPRLLSPEEEEQQIKINQSRVRPPAPVAPKTYFDPQRGMIVSESGVATPYAEPRPVESPEEKRAFQQKLQQDRLNHAERMRRESEGSSERRHRESLAARAPKSDEEKGVTVLDQGRLDYDAAKAVITNNPELGTLDANGVFMPSRSWYDVLGENTEETAPLREKFQRLVEEEKARRVQMSKSKKTIPSFKPIVVK